MSDPCNAAEQQARQQHERHDQPRVPPVRGDELGHRDADAADDGADGKIDPAGEDDKGRADGGGAEHGVVGNEILEHADREEPAVVKQQAQPVMYSSTQTTAVATNGICWRLGASRRQRLALA